MWLTATSSAGQDAQNALVIAIITAGSGLLVAVAAGLFNVMSAKAARHSQEIPESQAVLLFERTAVLSARADDSDDRDEAQDRRLDHIERVLDVDNPTWRTPPGPFHE